MLVLSSIRAGAMGLQRFFQVAFPACRAHCHAAVTMVTPITNPARSFLLARQP